MPNLKEACININDISGISYWIPQWKKSVEYSSFGPAQLKPLILNVAILNDDHLNSGVWPKLEINFQQSDFSLVQG
jgi:hypothetical protein